ncbi:hypothetical protein BJX66DRAFT_294833 [Aspergillus keveii]|uniref:Secreted protein n=1 Tax=Aspergillus keveii TaxID=714993 RepID=A0ABR4GIB2_9EURO
MPCIRFAVCVAVRSFFPPCDGVMRLILVIHKCTTFRPSGARIAISRFSSSRVYPAHDLHEWTTHETYQHRPVMFLIGYVGAESGILRIVGLA